MRELLPLTCKGTGFFVLVGQARAKQSCGETGNESWNIGIFGVFLGYSKRFV